MTAGQPCARPATTRDSLTDALGRTARYLRLSITDRCNLACIYCRPIGKGCDRFIPHDKILRYEELLRFTAIATRLGVGKLRVTGGEPFARKGCAGFLAALREQFPGLRLSVTTNGTLLRPHLPLLCGLGLDSVNLSLDSFRRATFAAITGSDLLSEVLASLDALLAGGVRVKLNVVAMRGVNDAELGDFLHAAMTLPVDLRFIEFMPMGKGTGWRPERCWPATEILAHIARQVRLLPLERDAAAGADSEAAYAGPARLYALEGGRGRIGVISPLSRHFCAHCNRLRLTSAGNVRVCLYDDREYRLAGLLRNRRMDDARVAHVLRLAIRRKPLGAELLRARTAPEVAAAAMHGIGG